MDLIYVTLIVGIVLFLAIATFTLPFTLIQDYKYGKSGRMSSDMKDSFKKMMKDR